MELTIDDIPTEITVYDGEFQNMLTDHQLVPCTCLIIGHHQIKANKAYSCHGFYRNGSKKVIVGIAHCVGEGIFIANEHRELIEKVLDVYLALNKR